MKFVVLNLALLVGYFSYIAGNQAVIGKVNDKKNIKTNQTGLLTDVFKIKSSQLPDEISEDFKDVSKHRKEVLNKVNLIQRKFSSVTNFTVKDKYLGLIFQREKISSKRLDQLKNRYSLKPKPDK